MQRGFRESAKLDAHRPWALMAAVGAVILTMGLMSGPAASATVSRETLCAETLQFGDSGGCVSELQQRLNEIGANLSVDGAFGWGTYYAVVAFQGRNWIGFDGVVGPNTQAYLNDPGAANLVEADPGTINNYIAEVFGPNAADAQRIANCESGGLHETAVGYNSNDTHDIGVFQMNEINAGGDLGTFRHDMLYYQSNVQRAYQLFLEWGGFGAWVCQ